MSNVGAMFSPPPKGDSLFVEPLESRIAPTNLIGYANDPSKSSIPHYITYHTAPSSGKLGFVPGSVYGVAGSDVYALKLTTGDELLIYNTATGFNPGNPFLQATNGTLIAFFQDKNGDGQVQSDELTGISLARGTSAEVNGNVNGDIVTNLTAAGTITLNSAGGIGQTLGGLNIVGNVYGDILSGGNINNVSVSGSVKNVLAGTATAGAAYYFAGQHDVATGTLTAVAAGAGHAGASIDGLNLLSVGVASPDQAAYGVIRAGHGGAHGAGGSISDVTLQSDTTGTGIFAGAGGAGTVHAKGGAGGSVTGVDIKGVLDDSPDSNIRIESGQGGPDRQFQGGSGGAISGVAVSYDTPVTTSQTPTQSVQLLDDNILLKAGAGGLGHQGGNGGSISDSFLLRAIPAASAQIPEIEVVAGAGGAAANAAAGRGGFGGGISQVSARYLDTNLATYQSLNEAPSTTNSILMEGGNGGTGADGGSVQGVTLLGTILNVEGGNGGAGRLAGGSGGNLNTVGIDSNGDVFATSLTLNAGVGGAGNHGAGGNGGNVTNVDAGSSALATLIVDGGTHGNGGLGSRGAGGAGGSVTTLTINDSGAAGLGTVNIRTGSGGNGFLGGGDGGDLGTSQAAVQLLGVDFNYDLATGSGGNVLPKGHGIGGAGGDLNTVGVANVDLDPTVAVSTGATGMVSSGNGGNGSTGGRAGDMDSVDLSTSANASFTTGHGGSGRLQAAGAGGGVFNSAGNSLFGSVIVIAGNAGGGGNAPGAGGTINTFVAAADNNVTLRSGNGTFGGAGGDITGCGTTVDQVPIVAPTGDIIFVSNLGSLKVVAGHGSSANGVGGAGGSITAFNGLVGQSGTTTFTAGAGGGGTNKTASGAGGSISAVTLTGLDGRDNNAVDVTFDGGNAGNASKANHGAAGGSVSNVTISSLQTGTVVQHVAAGSGGHGVRQGGAGGAISQVHVGTPGDTDADIGVRAGLAYGYAIGSAGGLFAGVGGTSAKTPGVAGDVSDITAAAIASIAAGKSNTVHLAHIVNNIYLEGLVATTAAGTGVFTNFGSANLVGSVIDPTANHASTYESGDGLIAAAVITVNRNFIPEAELTRNSNGQLELVDYRQPNPTPVITPVG
jgi:hypothetical protein